MVSLKGFHALLDLAGSLPPLPIAVVAAAQDFVLQGVQAAVSRGLIKPTLVGDEGRIRNVWAEVTEGQPPAIVAPEEGETTAACGMRLVREGRAQALMKGMLHTRELMRAVLQGLRTEKRVSHCFVVELPSYHKLLFVTDAAINIAPDLEAKAGIVQNAIDLARLLGVERPNVAVLSAVETINPAIGATIDAACLSKMAERGQIEGAAVEGPLAFDNAISRDAAETKGIVGPVPGEVDILLVPDLDAGNILVKDLAYLAKATLAGLVLGARVPVILTSRSDPPQARLVSAALASLLYHRGAENGERKSGGTA